MFRGVGITAAKALSPRAQKLLAARLAADKGDCTSKLPVDGSNATCLDEDFVDAIAACKYGLPKPADVPLGVWTDFCRTVGTCKSWLDLPGCPSFDQSYGNTVPGCIDADFKRDHVEYCDKYPLSDGPDAKLNEACWIASKSPTFLYNARVAPLCAGGDSSPISTAGMGGGMLKWGLIAGAAVVGLVLVARKR